jgi:hypothetical protein
MVSSAQRSLEDPVYELGNLAKLGELDKFNNVLEKLEKSRTALSQFQKDEIAEAKLLCHRNAIFALEQPCDEYARSGDLAGLEEGIKKLSECHRVTNQQLDPSRIKNWRDLAVTSKIDTLLDQASDFAKVGETAQRDAQVAQAQEIARNYNYALSNQQLESVAGSLNISRVGEINRAQDEIVRVVHSEATATAKLKKAAVLSEKIDVFRNEAGIRQTAEELRTARSAWGEKLFEELVASAHKLVAADPDQRTVSVFIEDIRQLSKITGLDVPQQTIEAIEIVAINAQINKRVISLAVTAISGDISEYDRRELEIRESVKSENSKGRLVGVSLTSDQLSQIDQAFITSREHAISQHLNKTEKFIAAGKHAAALESLLLADAITAEKDPRYSKPATYDPIRKKLFAEIGDLQVGELFQAIGLIVKQGDVAGFTSTEARIKSTVESFGTYLSEAQQKFLTAYALEVRQNMIQQILAKRIDKLDIDQLIADLRAVKQVVEQGGEYQDKLQLSANALRLMDALAK